MKKSNYDIFISYRRSTGYENAKLIHERLKQEGYRVFLDNEAMHSGDFNEQLFSVIDNCTDFILVLSKNALDRCIDNEHDWVRLETERALERKKNIVPIMLENFTFPESLPKKLEKLPKLQAVTPSKDFWDASMDKLIRYLHSSPKEKYHRRLVYGIPVTVFLLALTVVLFILFQRTGNNPDIEFSNIPAPAPAAAESTVHRESSAAFMLRPFEDAVEHNPDTIGDNTFWDQVEYKRKDVSAIVFHNALSNIPDKTWDVSYERNRSILAWMDGSTLHVAANGRIQFHQNSSHLFCGFVNLEHIDFGDVCDASNIQNMSSMFAYCRNLTELVLPQLQTASITNMNSSFSGCTSLQTLNVSDIDTSNVTNMNSLFDGCASLSTLEISSWDTSHVESMNAIFRGCSNLQTLDISRWQTARASSMDSMFRGCSALTELDLSGWNVVNVKTLSYLFADCLNLVKLDVSSWNTSNVTDFSWAFALCQQLQDFDVSGWKTDHAVTMNGMFSNCWSIKELDLSKWNVSTVTDFTSFAIGCKELQTLNVTGWRIADNAITRSMLAGCSNLTELICDSPLLSLKLKAVEYTVTTTGS